MSDFLLTAAHHEAGHAIVGHFYGYVVINIELEFDNQGLKHGITQYEPEPNAEATAANLHRRVLRAMGGPIAQSLFEQSEEVDLSRSEFEHDMKVIDSILIGKNKNKLIQDAIYEVFALLKSTNASTARYVIANELYLKNRISGEQFREIFEKHCPTK